ncbi:Protein SET [Smittium culicis]|uniref:Protein SET n=1 Tax=Smittium culicis TaxID=133412 RepID=A0A1R1YNI1_9FUNG|nr:Protein SET [Smittium culicis]OMJ28443.1 Protein SET [Smittium culicis]
MSSNAADNADFAANLEDLFNLQDKFEPFANELHDEIYRLQAQYELKKSDLYDERSQIIAKIPNFWQRAIDNQTVLSTMIEEEDSAALEFLTNVKIDRDASNPSIFKIIFNFSDNPYFSNSELVQKVDLTKKDEPKLSPEPIEWKEGKCLVKPITEETDEEDEETSFFTFFTEDGNADLAELIANDFYPNAISYFKGEFGDDMSDQEIDENELDDDIEDEEDDEDASGDLEESSSKRPRI